METISKKGKAKEFFISVIIISLVFSIYYFNVVGAVNQTITDSNTSIIENLKMRNVLGINTKVFKPDDVQPLKWRIVKADGDEEKLFNVTIDNENKTVCLTQKFTGTKEIPEPFTITRVLKENASSSDISAERLFTNNSLKIYSIDEGGRLIENEITFLNRTLRQPSTINVTLKGGEKSEIGIQGNRFCQSLENKTYIKFGEHSIILQGDTSYDSTNVNVTQNTGFAHLNISTAEPYLYASSGYGLVSYFNFDFNDSTSVYDFKKSRTGTFAGGLAPVEGIYGDALQFDGINDYLSFNSFSDLSPLKTGTITGWFMVNSSVSGTVQFIFTLSDKDVSTDLVQIGVGNVGGVANETFWYILRSSVDSPITYYLIDNENGSTRYYDNKWHHFAVRMGGSNYSLNNAIFIDGVSQTLTLTNGNLTSYAFLDISNADTARLGSRYFNGAQLYGNLSLDEFMIFNRSLTDAQIQDIYLNQSKRFPIGGNQTFENVNVSVDGNENRINITLSGFNTYFGTNFSAKVNGGSYINFSDTGFVSGVSFTSDPNAINITLKYLSGSNEFISPLLWGNITVDSYFENTGNASCTYSGSGDWNITCSQNCNIGSTNISGDLNITGGNGVLNVTGLLNFTTSGSHIYIAPPSCYIHVQEPLGGRIELR